MEKKKNSRIFAHFRNARGQKWQPPTSWQLLLLIFVTSTLAQHFRNTQRKKEGIFFFFFKFVICSCALFHHLSDLLHGHLPGVHEVDEELQLPVADLGEDHHHGGGGGGGRGGQDLLQVPWGGGSGEKGDKVRSPDQHTQHRRPPNQFSDGEKKKKREREYQYWLGWYGQFS